jgi:hypothetical protein
MDILVDDIKRSICSLFEVYAGEKGVQRIVTPIEYAGTSDRVVVRIRPEVAAATGLMRMVTLPCTQTWRMEIANPRP